MTNPELTQADILGTPEAFDTAQAGIFDLLVYCGVVARVDREQLAERLTRRVLSDLDDLCAGRCRS